MDDNDPNPIEDGATGTIMGYYPFNGGDVIDVDWDNGRTLKLIDSVDKWELIP